MNSLIEWLNVWGGRFMDFVLPIFWQSSLLIAVVFAFDFLLRRKVRAAVRYSLWLVVFVKLVVPPTLALPTGAAWWVRSRPVLVAAPHTRMISVNYAEPVETYVPSTVPLAHISPPAPTLRRDGWMLLAASAVSGFLALWVLFRWRQIARCVKRTTAASVEVAEMLSQARRLAGLRRNVMLRVTSEAMSPAVCGLFRPVILLPQSLIEKLTASQLRAVLLHELIHLRRRDVWVNCAQTLLQIVYWWHPLLWIANARVRRVREEAVDDAVMCALSAEAEVYAPTLLEVAKLAFARPLASLGLVGILESRSALRHRIERLLNFTTPRRAGVSMVSVICLAAFTALAVPMGEPPARTAAATDDIGAEKLISYHAKVDSEVFTRNILARAEGTLHTTNDDLNEILVSLMDEFNVDCTGERAIRFNPATGEVTARNTGEALQVLDQVVRELNLKGGEIVLNPPYGLKQVLIEAQFYLLKPADSSRLELIHDRVHHDDDLSPWWELPPGMLTENRDRLKEAGIQPISSPRIQTAHGVTASLFVGDGTNNIQLECVPYVRNGMVNLTALARTSGEYAPGGKDWPDIAGHTNCAIFSRVSIPDGTGVAWVAKHIGAEASQDSLLVLLKARILEPAPKSSAVGAKQRATGNSQAIPQDAYTSATREKVLKELNDITFVKIGFPYLPLGEVLSNLTEMVKRRDPDHEGVKFSLNAALPPESHSTNDNDMAFVDLGSVAVNVDLKNARLLDVLDAIVKTADHPIKYSVLENGAVQFSFRERSVSKQDVPLLGDLPKVGRLFRSSRAATPRNVPGPGTLPDGVTSLAHKVQYENGGTDNAGRSRLPVPNPYAGTNRIYTSPQRQQIYQKLNSIVFDKISFPDMRLGEVVANLTQMTLRRDIDQQGINFILNKTRPPAASETVSGQPAPAPEDVDLASVTINIDPGLKNVRLLDVLEAITKSADHPISYAMLDYGIEFNLKGPDQVQLHVRTFRVDPNTFLTGLQNHGINVTNLITAQTTTGGGSGGTQIRYVKGFDPVIETQLAVISFFQSIGVNLAAPKSVFFNDRQGTLTVRATDEDLEKIEKAIDTLNIPPPEVTVKARFVEITDEDMSKPGFEWFLEMMAKNGNDASGLAGILTEPQFRTVLKNIRQRKGADLLEEGEVTTLSGRQAQFQLLEMDTNQAAGNQATNIPFGKSVDVVPYVITDGYTIQLTVTPTITERVEYDTPATFVPTIQSGNGGIPVTGQLPLPRARVRHVVVSCTVWDGQTAAILMGPYKPHGRNTVVFVTTTIIDPSGNRKNSDESLPFAQKAVPPQPSDK